MQTVSYYIINCLVKDLQAQRDPRQIKAIQGQLVDLLQPLRSVDENITRMSLNLKESFPLRLVFNLHYRCLARSGVDYGTTFHKMTIEPASCSCHKFKIQITGYNWSHFMDYLREDLEKILN